jgi:hypothetical protein
MFLSPFAKTVKVPKSVTYRHVPGCFGVVRRRTNAKTHRRYWDIEWMTCRDSFHTAYINSLWCGYSFDPLSFFFCNEPEKTKKFVHEIENHLSLTCRSKFLKTDTPNIVCLVPSLFWRSCPMRMSFYTIMLKASLNYKDAWEDCLMAHPYIKDTQAATSYFLSGHTVYRGYGSLGWRSEFQLHKKPPVELLRRPRFFVRRMSEVLLFMKNIFSSKLS